MQNSFWSPFVSDGTVRAIYWTLIHSLWIGLIIALFCGIVIATTRKSTAALRYRLLCGLLVLFVLSIGATYSIETRLNTTSPAPSVPLVTVVIGTGASVSQQLGTVLNRSIVDQTMSFLNQNGNIIFLVWLLFFIFKCMKMVSGLLHIQRIRNYKTQTVTEELKHRIEHFSSQIGIRWAVRLVQSELVKVPGAVGWLEPMILLPVGILFQFSPEQIDSILWHELAHIRRSDYLVNILQGIVETVFFFNPGLLWLSSLIRAEREACCDDMVLSRMNKKANYLEALLAFGYGEFKTTGWAMGVGSGNQLGDRLKRMINRENKRLGVVEKVFLITGIVVLSGFAGLRSVNKKYMTQVNYETQVNTAAEKALNGAPAVKPGLKKAGVADDKIDSVVSLSSTLYKKGDNAPVKLEGGENTLADEADTTKHFFNLQYRPKQADKNNYAVFANDAAQNKYEFVVKDSKLVAMTINGNDIQRSDLPKYTYLLKHIPPPPPPPPMQPAGISADKADTVSLWHLSMKSRSGEGDTTIIDKGEAMDNRGRKYQFIAADGKLISMDINGEKIKNSDLPKYQYIMTLVREKQKPHADQNKKLAELIRQPDKPQPPTPPVAPPSLDKMITDVTNDLINEHIIKDKSGLATVKLTYSELIVNGVKQPDELQKKFAAKYYPGNSRTSKDPNYGLWYNAKTHGAALGTFNLDLDDL